MSNRAAVVIGVNKTGGLPSLRSAALGAQQVATWLKGQNFEVECLHDESGPVTKAQVEKAISKFVTNPPRVHLLLVYFSGHGYWQARNDQWLLSLAPVNTSEAINLGGAMDLARYSGIPNVIFISDACRSIPNARDGGNVKGIDAFPNYVDIDTVSKVDYLKATAAALPAYEVSIAGETRSVLTHALMSAYSEPEAHMVREIQEAGKTISVVPNRQLEGYVQSKVDELLNAIDSNLSQPIECYIPSEDNVYISRVLGPVSSKLGAAPSARLGVGQHVAAALTGELTAGPGGSFLRDVDAALELERQIPSDEVNHFETQVGFTVRGAIVAGVVMRNVDSTRVEVLAAGDGGAGTGKIRLYDVKPAASVGIIFQDGRCTIIPALAGYIGHVLVTESGVTGVNYVPSSNHRRWSDYSREKGRIELLRGLIAVAIEHNTFRIRSRRDGEALAARIREMKGRDPTLGLYAAHAYSQAANEEQVADVLRFMREDLHADLFDVRLLASRSFLGRAQLHDLPVVPFCPMLTETWNLLSARQFTLPLVLDQASAYLCDSLWTTFEPDGAKMVLKAMEQGDV